MTADPIVTGQEHHKPKGTRQGGGGSDTVYGLGLIGAWVFYMKGATTFQQRAQGFFKGLVWPAFLVYDLLVFLKKQNTPD